MSFAAEGAMSDEQEDVVYGSVPQYLTEYVAPYPFPSTDAALSTFLDEQGEKMHFRARWRQTSAGSARHTVTTRENRLLGEFRTRAIDNQKTYINVIPANPLPTYVPWLLEQFAMWIHTNLIRLRWVGEHQIAPAPSPPPELPPLLAEPKRAATHEPPDRDASIDAWLDWRDVEIARGRSSRAVSLPRIAKDSSHSLSTLKRHSAARNKRPK